MCGKWQMLMGFRLAFEEEAYEDEGSEAVRLLPGRDTESHAFALNLGVMTTQVVTAHL